LGPGLSLDPETQRLVRDLVMEAEKPLLIDGDGLTAISAAPECVRSRSAPTILTPHLGEMARLTGRTVAELEADKVAAAQHTAADLGAILVLKGAHTLIGCPDGRVYFNLSGNAGMATAGSGDVLTGAIAAMHGLGLPVEEAVRQGVLVHGVAGDLAAQANGEDGITAQDVMEFLPAALRACRAGLTEPRFAHYWGPQVV
jgi:ADP-dependent NAD(P)H-hydrate dehydratase / NAD(P)H-hydrate epimerase